MHINKSLSEPLHFFEDVGGRGGHRAPMHELDQLIAYMKSKPGVWFATAEQIARYVKSEAEPK